MNDAQIDCAHSADAAAYVLGALEASEAETFRTHLSSCPRCRSEVADLQPSVDLLAATAPEAPAPAHLRDRIMSVVNSEAELLQAAGHEADRPPRRRSFRLAPIGALAAAAALAAGVVIGVVATGSGGSPTHVTRAVVASTQAGASAQLRQSGGRAELEVSHLSQAPPGRIYEVWLQRAAGAPQPTDALFVVDHAGNAVVAVPGGLHGVKRMMVTNEPVGGSSFPTTAPVITVPLAT